MRIKFVSLNNRKGFTLLELVIAMTILTLITVIIGYGLKLGINAWKKGERETEETQRLRILSSMISQQLKSAYPYRLKIDDKFVVLFEGTEDSLLFVTSAADDSFGGIKWVRYTFKDDTIYYKEGILPDKDILDHIDGDEEDLDSDIERLKFEYYIGHTGEWMDSWDFDENMPRAVRVTISYFQPFQVNIPYASRVKGGDEENEIL